MLKQRKIINLLYAVKAVVKDYDYEVLKSVSLDLNVVAKRCGYNTTDVILVVMITDTPTAPTHLISLIPDLDMQDIPPLATWNCPTSETLGIIKISKGILYCKSMIFLIISDTFHRFVE